MQHFMTFFRNADSVRVVSSSSGYGQSQATKYIICIFEAEFFIIGAIKSATLSAHAVFASLTAVVSLVRSRTQLLLTNCTKCNATITSLELTITPLKLVPHESTKVTANYTTSYQHMTFH